MDAGAAGGDGDGLSRHEQDAREATAAVARWQARVDELRAKVREASVTREAHSRAEHPYAPFPVTRLEAAVAAVPPERYLPAERPMTAFGNAWRFRYGRSGPPGRFAPFAPPPPPVELITPLWPPSVGQLSREALPLVVPGRHAAAPPHSGAAAPRGMHAAAAPRSLPLRAADGAGARAGAGPALSAQGGNPVGAPPGAGRAPWTTQHLGQLGLGGAGRAAAEAPSRGSPAGAVRLAPPAAAAGSPRRGPAPPAAAAPLRFRASGRGWPRSLGLAASAARRLAAPSGGGFWLAARLGGWV